MTSGYLNDDTITSIASGLGGAIAVVRVSGSRTFEVLRRLFPADFNRWDKLRTLHRVALRTPEGRPLDDAMVALFRAPESYTGEDAAELFLHGGSWTVSRVVEALIEAGARQARAGEFSFRAVRSGKMTLSQAEAVHELIQASNEGAAELALEKLSGSQAKWVGALSEEIRQTVALGEIGIDFADQDVEEVSLPALKARLGPLLEKLRKLHDSFQRGRRIQEGVRAAFLGLPNAGKSSLFNALLGQDRSIVSEVAGTTRDVVHEKVTLYGPNGSVTLRLEDTAGLRRSSDPIESVGIERARKAVLDADLLVWVIGLDQGPGELVRALEAEWEIFHRPRDRSVLVFTKNDLPSALSYEKEWREALTDWSIPILGASSSTTGVGVSELAAKLATHLRYWVQRDPGELILTQASHQVHVRDAIHHLERALTAEFSDLFAADLRQALTALSPLIGTTVPDDILGRIFSQFCIGK